MLERAFVFEITARPSGEVVGAGAICLARHEVAIWRSGTPSPLLRRLPARQWTRLARQLAASLPTGNLPLKSPVADAVAAPLGRGRFRVQYLGVFPLDAAEWLPDSHPASAVLKQWQPDLDKAG